MEHQPFKMWLVDHSDLNEDELEILQNHLSACPDCSELERDLVLMDQAFQNSPLHNPQAGFSRRFLASLPERRQKEQMRQVRNWMTGIFIALAINFMLILAAAIFTRTTSAWLVNLVALYGSLLAIFEGTSLVLHTVSLVIPQQVWIPLIITVIIWGIAGIGLWILTMRKILFSGAANEA